MARRTEQVELTNMCMIYDGEGNILVQNRKKQDWAGITFPGGHVEKGESFVESVIREVKEETGLDLVHPKLCGVKQWYEEEKDFRYVLLFFKCNQFFGELCSSEEGEVFWIPRKDLLNYPLAPDFERMVEVFESDELSEFFYRPNGDQWDIELY